MTITLNGDPREVDDGLTIGMLLSQLELDRGTVAVAINREFVPRSEHATHRLRSGDAVELVAPMQGG